MRIGETKMNAKERAHTKKKRIRGKKGCFMSHSKGPTVAAFHINFSPKITHNFDDSGDSKNKSSFYFDAPPMHASLPLTDYSLHSLPKKQKKKKMLLQLSMSCPSELY